MQSPRRPHASALRIGRVSEPNQIYAVTSATFERRPVFRDLYVGRILVRALWSQQQTGRAATLAYVVMPDHFHWLMQLLPGADLSAVVRSVKGRSAREINCAVGSAGSRIWQPGFHDHAVRKEEDLVALAGYVIANPVRAGLVRCIAEYSLWDSVWTTRELDGALEDRVAAEAAPTRTGNRG